MRGRHQDGTSATGADETEGNGFIAFVGCVLFSVRRNCSSLASGVLRGVLRQKFVDHVFGSACQNAAVKQTTKLFVDIVRADRRAKQRSA